MDYMQKDVEGLETTWRRISFIEIHNPHMGTPRVVMKEEDVTSTPSGKQLITHNTGILNINFDPSNPKHMQIYNLLNEVYVEAREARDALQEESTEPSSFKQAMSSASRAVWGLYPVSSG